MRTLVAAAIVIATLALPAAAGPRRPIEDARDPVYLKAARKALAAKPGTDKVCTRTVGRYLADAIHRRCMFTSGSSSPQCHVDGPCVDIIEEMKLNCAGSIFDGIPCWDGPPPVRP
ncbi:hypothetical protein [Methylobacterium iners]|uniref:Uncharacterized protein n=1 Tax=Methylobacterium iners TaxID=418707 RepID=A0ABQ4S2S3_9HYPH|nr:hypothetical protein [Methylobacterium iners]GJD97433.1 hypothetical protein OCOJLMKI_4664 [Methylobacterium iners]